MSNPIGWCDKTVNYVWGCTHGCKYCYARKFARRYASEMARLESNYINNLTISRDTLGRILYTNGWGFTNNVGKWFRTYLNIYDNLNDFKPTLLTYKLAQSLPKKPQRIFLDSMSDVADWKPEWYEKILQKICENIQHTFIILTKRPEIYREYTFPHNVWLGVTACTNKEIKERCYKLFNTVRNNKIFLSVEPMLEEIDQDLLLSDCNFTLDWIIAGPETGNRKKKIYSLSTWMESFYKLKIPVYMKESCSKIIDTPLRQEWPE
jgi:protein gp37